MSRLANQMNAGYVPTPPDVVRRIAQHLGQPHRPFRILDPCAGEGNALASLRRQLYYAQLFAIELDAERAAQCTRNGIRTLTGSYAAQRLPKKDAGISLLFLNPPYDYDEEAGRLELRFLRDTQDWLMPDGVLVYLIPQYRISRHIAARLATHFHSIQVERFPDPDYAIYKQVVIFGVKRHQPEKDDVTAAWLIDLAQRSIEPLDRYYNDEKYRIPEQPDTSFYFITAESDPEDVAREAIKHGVWATREWADLQTPRNAQAVQPLMPLRSGHIAMVLAAGLLDNLEVEKDGEQVLVKGRLVKKLENVTDATDRVKKLTRTRESFSAHLTTLDLKTGQVERLQTTDELTTWLKAWQGPLARKIVETFEPLHDMTYDGLNGFDAITDSHSKHRKLKGRRKTGLFESQKQVTAALTRRYLSGARFALLQATMGTGKTTIAASLADVLRKTVAPGNPFPVIVTCPPHLINKWPREIAEVVPMARGIPVKTVADLEAYVKEVETTGSSSLPIAVVPTSMLKLGSGWTPAYGTKIIIRQHKVSYNHYERVRVTVFTCPRCGQTIYRYKDGAPTFPVQDASYFDKRKTCKATVKTWAGDADGKGGHWKEVTCNEPLYQMWRGKWLEAERDSFGSLLPLKACRYSIAEYIRRQYPDFFELAIIDEVHEGKAQSTDRGNAFAHLIRASKRVLGMTGTLFGGFATSLFYIMHRMDSRIRTDFEWGDAMRWASLYGVLERTMKSDQDDSYGHYSGLRRRRAMVRERPGISPALVTRLLDSTVFMTLEDLGFELPPYVEKPVLLNMISGNGQGPDQAEIYTRLARDLLAAAMDDFKLMSEYLQTTLSWPNACWREEETSLYTEPALRADILYPKEQWLLDTCKAELQEGRKVLLFVRQTATRDIQPRLKGILDEQGLATTILRSSVGTSKREAWVNRKVAGGLDVLICNPRLVQTGLDLVAFPTTIFYEPEYSIYLMMQASRRTWRLGQTEPVKIYFACYRGTMEHRAVAHVGKKIAAAQLLYGDSVAGALVDQAGVSGNFLEDLARDVIANAQIPDLSTVFMQKARQAEQTGWLTGAPVDLAEVVEMEIVRESGAIAPTQRWEIKPSTVSQPTLF